MGSSTFKSIATYCCLFAFVFSKQTVAFFPNPLDNVAQNSKRVFAESNGAEYKHHPYGSLSAGPGGPLLLQDFHLIDSLAHFDRERIPERVVHAKGGGAHGYFELTDSLSDITIAEPFQTPGATISISMRFSVVAGESGSPDTYRDPRGFAIKLRTNVGNLDWVFNNTPIFFIRDPNKFPHFIHSQKRDPKTNLNQHTDSTQVWDYFVQNIESIHQVTYLFGDRGTPADWGKMNGYSGHTFKMYNSDGNLTYVQIHVKADTGFVTLDADEADELTRTSPDYHQKTLYNNIDGGNFPSWTLYIQTMTPEQAENFRYSINDLTKVWPHKEFPLRRFGKMVLNQNAEDYFSEIEQLAFSPSYLIPGIEASNDPVLQARLFSYPDTHRHRLGTNYQQLPVNRPRTFDENEVKSGGCPFLSGNFQRGGASTFDNQHGAPNYINLYNSCPYATNGKKNSTTCPQAFPNNFTGVVMLDDENQEIYLQKIESERNHELKIWKNSLYWISGFEEKDLEQPRKLHDVVFTPDAQDRFVNNIVSSAKSIHVPELKTRVAQYWGLLNGTLGQRVADGLNLTDYKTLDLEDYADTVGRSSAY